MTPCIRCGSTDRYSSGNCKPCTQKRNAIWRAANTEKFKADKAAWAKRNSKLIVARVAKWKRDNPDKHKKNARRYKMKHEKKIKFSRVVYNKTASGRYARMANRDRKKGRETMTLEEYRSFEGTLCHYCQFPRASAGYGLDRRDNKKGHTFENTLPCCHECNVARSDRFTVEEMELVLGPAIRQIKLARQSKESLCTVPR